MIAFREAKASFFDKKAIIDAIGKANVRVLSKFGAFVRATARKSLKYGESRSTPGSPPTVHKTLLRTKTNKKGETKNQSVSPLRDFLFFSLDKDTRSVVIGPVKLSGKMANLGALESGGESVISDGRKTRTVRIAARPFMVPAFDKELPKLSRLWEGAVR